MIISHTNKFIFIHIQRTGGSTIINLLKTQLGEDLIFISQHGNARSSENYLLDDHKDYFTFAFVRNPWERILSWYLLINKENQQSLEEERSKFEKFLELDYAAVEGDLTFHYNQVDYISNKSGDILVDNVYRFENFEIEVGKMLNDLGLSLIDIPKMNKTWDKNYHDYYTEKSKELIEIKCKKDIEYFAFKY